MTELISYECIYCVNVLLPKLENPKQESSREPQTVSGREGYIHIIHTNGCYAQVKTESALCDYSDCALYDFLVATRLCIKW